MSQLNIAKGVVEMVHGGGGRAMSELIGELFAGAFDNEWLNQQNDQAQFTLPAGRPVMATDSHVIDPLFFPGGNIGSLSIHGTVNDVCLCGATPLYLSAGFILEEGFPLKDLKVIVDSMAAAAREAGVAIVTGDTKVVEKGKGDGVFINTAGVGVIAQSLLDRGLNMSGSYAQPGDKVLLSGTIGDHGTTILSLRESLGFEAQIQSDSQSLNTLVAAMVNEVPQIRCMRDPTRGGLANTLNELARQSNVGMQLNENAIPVREEVKAACEFLGLDPLYVANEGKLIAICPADKAEALLTTMKAHPQGADAAIIGEVVEDEQNFIQMETIFGGNRMVDWLNGEQLPRIC